MLVSAPLPGDQFSSPFTLLWTKTVDAVIFFLAINWISQSAFRCTHLEGSLFWSGYGQDGRKETREPRTHHLMATSLMMSINLQKTKNDSEEVILCALLRFVSVNNNFPFLLSNSGPSPVICLSDFAYTMTGCYLSCSLQEKYPNKENTILSPPVNFKFVEVILEIWTPRISSMKLVCYGYAHG